MTESEREPSRLEVELARTVRRLSSSRVSTSIDTVEHPVNADHPPTLTIGLSTYDDFDGAYFTVTSLLTHHRTAMRRCEIVILDNHPEGPESQPLQALAREYSDPPVRYLPYADVRSTAVRDVIFGHARTPWVMVLDSHVLLEPGAVDALLAYIDAHPDSPDLIQGPLVRADGTVAATQMDPGFGGAMYGRWGTDERIEDPDCEPFEIPAHGLALFAMNAERWPGLNQRFTGFGGEEGYVHEKVRQAGGATLCLPALRWHHRFARPRGIPYPMDFSDRVNNYLAGWTEIGWDVSEVHRAFSALIGDHAYAEMRAEVERRLHHPADATIICVASDDDRVGPWRKVLAEADAQGIHVVRISASRTEHGDGWWEEILARVTETAARRRWTSVTVIDEGLGLPPALSYRILARSQGLTGGVIRGTRDGEAALVVVPETAAGSPRALAQVLARVTGGDAPDSDGTESGGADVEFEVEDHLLERHLDPALVGVGWTISGVDEQSDWLAVYARWAHAGLGSTMHRHPAIVDVPPELQEAYGWAEVLRLAAETDTPVIIGSADIHLSEDVGAVLSAAIREFDGTVWDLLSLSTESAADDAVEREVAFAHPCARPDSAVVVVSRSGIERLTAVLPDPGLEHLATWRQWLETWGDVSAWLAAQVADGALTAWATHPALAVRTASWKRERPAHAGRMRR